MTQTKAELLQTRHQGDIRLGDADSTHYVGFKAPATVGSNLVWTLPAVDGSANYLLKTDGSGNLGWVADSSTDSTKMPLAGGTFTGNTIYNDNIKSIFGTGSDLQIYHDGTSNIIKSVNSNSTYIDGQAAWVYLQSNAGIQLGDVGGNEVFLKATDNGAVELYYDNSKKFETTSAGAKVTGELQGTGDLHLNNGTNSGKDVKFVAASNLFRIYDDVKLTCGTDDDLQIYHDGSSSYIDEVGTGSLKIQTNGTGVDIQKGSSETIARFIADAAVELYHNNVKKLETTSGGANVVGALTVNGAALESGGFASVQYFTSSGTWTKPSGIKIIRVTVIGGGGGGGNSNNVYTYGGNGGGAGGFSQKIIDVTSISSETVTIGAGGSGSSSAAGTAGGTTSFGSHCSASGGSGGAGYVQGSSWSGATTAGIGSNGNINLRGGYGSVGVRGQDKAVAGTGGNSVMWGAVNPGGLATGGGAPATYGSGGGGAATGTSASGGSGLVVVEEFK